MKVRLFYKIYAVILVAVIMSVGVSALTLGYFGYRNFSDYLVQSKLQEFSWLAQRLAEYYKKNGSFDAIRDFREQNKQMLDNRGPGRGFNGPHLPHFKPDFGGPMGGPPPMENGKFDRKEMERHEGEFLRKLFYNEKTGLNISALVRFQEFICILDVNKDVVTGHIDNIKDFKLMSIVSDGKVVGYLGMRVPPQIEHPLAVEFIKHQMSLMLISAVIIILLIGLVSWAFTKKLVAPVSGLIAATEKLAARNFNLSYMPESNDELGDLAVSFKKMAQELKMYEEKQSRWISDISHELRTPLSVLLGNIEAMIDGVRKMDAENTEVLYAEVKRLIKLVNELHEITMAESGNMTFDFTTTKVEKVLSGVINLYQSRAEEFGFALETMTKRCEFEIKADISRLRQVFINIIENSLKHAKSPGTIFIGCSKEDNFVLITFEDTGPGVAQEHLPMLFDRLYRSDRSRNRMTGGSGLGLAICKYIIEKHGGTIAALNSSMGGLRIEIRIPRENTNE